jgi:SAM-dependent methyltransferase
VKMVTPQSSDACPSACRFQALFRDVQVCSNCGLGRTVVPITPPGSQDYSTSDATVTRVRERYLGRIFRRYIQVLDSGGLLDIGCGSGLLLDIAERHGWRVRGVESFTAQVADRRIIRGSFLESQIDGRFDCISLIHSFEHMEDPRSCLRRCYDLLKPGGVLLVIVPNFSGAWARLTAEGWPWLNTKDHAFHYTVEALSSMILKSEFHIEECTTDSSEAPSFVEVYASVRKLFDVWPLRVWPVRSLIYRVARLTRVPANSIVDFLGRGAEIRVLARK